MFKFLVLIAIGFVVLALFRASQRTLGRPPSSTRENKVEDMVKCAHCGVNLPRSEAIYSGRDFFCTLEHKQLGRK
ncbi:MAG: PP0621 family protein [Betaproteobacteria bacterium]|nr:PP0621 family protein [Betaproteobacteria bacterium]